MKNYAALVYAANKHAMPLFMLQNFSRRFDLATVLPPGVPGEPHKKKTNPRGFVFGAKKKK